MSKKPKRITAATSRLSPEELQLFWKAKLFQLALALWAIKSLLFDSFERGMITLLAIGAIALGSRTVIASMEAGAKLQARRREVAEAAARRAARKQQARQAQMAASAKYFDFNED